MTNLTSASALLVATTSLSVPPETPKTPVTDTYHGVAITGDYRWLDDGTSPAVQKWSEAQNTLARCFTNLPASKRCAKLMAAKTTNHFALAV